MLYRGRHAKRINWPELFACFGLFASFFMLGLAWLMCWI